MTRAGLLLATLLALLPAAPRAAETAAAAIPGAPEDLTGGVARVVAGPLPRPEPAPADPRAAAELFAMPEIADETRRALGLVEAGDPEGAAAIFDDLVARHPSLGLPRIRRAALAMMAGDPDAALAGLEAAAGDPALPEALADPLFAPLAGDPGFVALAALPAPPAPPAPIPAPVAGGIAPLGAGNLAWDPGAERLVAAFAFPEKAEGPVLQPGPKDAARDLLREHVRRGRAAGNRGDLYDNRDRAHSRLRPDDFPQLARIVYSDAARAADLDYGLNDRLLFGAPTVGNSSTAITAGPLWRSLPRHAMTRADGAGPMRLWQTASANAAYVHPAHKDYGTDRGDLFPANTPYLLVSEGSSGSDRPFLEAVAMILAALRPDTKARATEAGMINSTVQMVFRRSQQHVTSNAIYHSGDAHPAAFAGYAINLARMVSLANSIEADALPAEARIRVALEEPGTEGVDFFGAGLSERLFDTPQAVARVWRSAAGRRTMVLSAEDSRDANGRPLAFTWALLQGDPAKVAIEPLDDGRRARVTIDWHDPFPISEENPQTTARVDIGVFAHNGAHDSAPAILSWSFPAHETRTYAPGPDGAPRPVSIDYADPAKARTYADPLLWPRAAWRDDYAYGPDGAPLGWTRIRAEAEPETFAPDGTRRLADGEAAPVAYRLAPVRGGGFAVEELSAELVHP
ncbi:hypothetical protein [Amaricoccus sp.]|uniref:hypothetical protein n=1 Tax=Amaricoccus sp. TaxID=1872485 RepID=UPI001B6A64B9|nr:hypothetical protein [Amaricoccus sp.]MBP7002998.1 hypothetical protein [Amaricoccus sp.]